MEKIVQWYVVLVGLMFGGILGWQIMIFLIPTIVVINLIREKKFLYHVFSLISLVLGVALAYAFIWLRLKYGF